MTASQSNLAPVIVPARGDLVDLTVIVVLDGSESDLDDFMDRALTALHSQLIPFEMITVPTGFGDDVWSGLESVPVNGRWAAVLSVSEARAWDLHEFIEHFHQAREAAAALT